MPSTSDAEWHVDALAHDGVVGGRRAAQARLSEAGSQAKPGEAIQGLHPHLASGARSSPLSVTSFMHVAIAPRATSARSAIVR